MRPLMPGVGLTKNEIVMIIFNAGADLFDRFNLSLESEIIYSDNCRDMIYVHQHGIKFTDKALLIMKPDHERDNWIECEFIEFCPWDNIIGFQNVRGTEILEEVSQPEICKWLSTIPTPRLRYPFLSARCGHIAYIVKGVPKSVRSKKGKIRLKQDVRNYKRVIEKDFGIPATGPVEIMIEIFSSDIDRLPDVDRLSSTIMDAFEGTVYESDKQVRLLQPHVYSSKDAYAKFECQTEPMKHFEAINIPLGSLYPLATGILDYYVVRILTYNR